MADLSGQVAIVTGASSGIGLAVAEALLGRGMTVVQVSRSITPASALPGATAIAADVTDRAAIHAAVATVIGDNGRVDLLVNCAGVMYFTLMKNAKYEQWERTIDVNCKGTVNATGAVLPHMLAAKRGHVVNISSDAARTLFGALTVYNAAKAFVHVFSKGLRAECVGTGLRVTDIQPGDTATNLIVKNDDAEAAAKMGARSLRVPLASFFFLRDASSRAPQVTIGAVVGGGEVGPSCLAPKDIADAVLYAFTAPAHVGVHEILIEPRDQMFGDPTAMNA